jgi:LPXTG-motif cell wall-anchored protein
VQTLAVTNTKRTRLEVDKQWIGVDRPVEVQFELYRRTGDAPVPPEEPDEITCAGGCGAAVADAQQHKAACGHYTCESGYTEAAHALCECGGYLCDGTDHSACGQPEETLCETCRKPITDESEHAFAACNTHRICMEAYAEAEHLPCGVCGNGYLCDTDKVHGEGECGASQTENVTVSLEIWHKTWGGDPVIMGLTGPSISVPAGSSVVWNLEREGSQNTGIAKTVVYDGGSVTCTEGAHDSQYGKTAFTITFTATTSGTIKLTFENELGKGNVWTNMGYTLDDAAPTAYTARSANASQTVDTTGAELVNINGQTTFTIPAGGSYTFWDLPAADDTGAAYRYFVREVTTGYVVAYNNNGGVAPDGSTITIINSEPEVITVSLTVRKAWLDENGAAATPPNYAVRYELREVGGIEPLLTGEELVLSQNNGWQQTHAGLDPAKSHYVKEVAVLSGTTDMSLFYHTAYQAGEGASSEAATDAAVTGGGTVTISNRLKPSYTLPNTGGSGTLLYTGAGALLILIALGLLYKGNKGKRRADA